MGTLQDTCAQLDTTKILIVDHSLRDVQLIRLLLSADPSYQLSSAGSLARAKALLRRMAFDLVLVDTSLPDGKGIEAVHELHCAAADVPLVALGARHDPKLETRALREGAQDYLVKSDTDRSLLVRVIRHAKERHRLVAALQSLALKDTLTGLYNRRGFVTLAEAHMKLARRGGQSFALAFVDLDGMKRINDTLGHEFGDQALMATADILRSTFRASDIAARLGGDEFIVLVIGASAIVCSRIKKRLQHAAALYNCRPGVVPVAFSVGFAHYDPAVSRAANIDKLMVEADQAMYAEKQLRRGSRTFQEKNCQGPPTAAPKTVPCAGRRMPASAKQRRPACGAEGGRGASARGNPIGSPSPAAEDSRKGVLIPPRGAKFDAH